ncbi:MAG: rRNA maturation RNase YbeY [bacterium]
MIVEVNWLVKSIRPTFTRQKQLEKAVNITEQLSGKRLITVSVAVVGEAESRKWNGLYRKKDYPTDVLAFPEGEKERGGEVVICWTVCKKQANEYGEAVKEEFNRLLIHGFLHLLGYDHELGKKEENVMIALQEKILAKLCL